MYWSTAVTLSFLHNVFKVFERLRELNVAVNPAKTKLGIAEVEYVGHVISTTGISFTEEKRLKVLKLKIGYNSSVWQITFGIMWDGTASTEADPIDEVQGLGKACVDTGSHRCFRVLPASNLQLSGALFLEDTATSILQSDASDYGIGGYVFMVTEGKVRVFRFFSKALIGERVLRHILWGETIRRPTG